VSNPHYTLSAENAAESAPDPGVISYGHFNPTYWDGHALGQGEVERPPVAVQDPRALLLAFSSIRSAFKEGCLLSGDSYSQQKEFYAEEFPAGTVVMFGREKVQSVSSARKPNMLKLLGAELPERPTALDINPVNHYGTASTSRRVEGIVYSYGVNVGVVSQDLLGRKLLAGVSGNNLNTSWLGSIKLSGRVLEQVQEAPVLRVGQVKHHGKKLGDYSETLARINSIEVRKRGSRATRSIFFPKPIVLDS
jgi:hypothetical protein